MHPARRIPRPGVRFVRFVLGVLVVLSGTNGFAAETNEFAFLIRNGKQFVTTVDKDGLEVSASSGLMFPVSDGVVVPQSQGQARITTWKRRVSDPFYKSLGTFAALIVFEFDAPMSLRAHLTQIQTPTGLQTAIGVQPLDGSETPPDLGRSICGTWFIQTTPVAGQGSQDLVIVGSVSINNFTLASPQAVALTRRAQQSFASDATPLTTHLVSYSASLSALAKTLLASGAVRMGSFYAKTILLGTAVPVRGFISNHVPAFWAHLLAIPTTPSDFVIVSCSAYGFADPVDATCLLSGSGPQLGRLTGTAGYTPLKSGTLLNVQPSYVLP